MSRQRESSTAQGHDARCPGRGDPNQLLSARSKTGDHVDLVAHITANSSTSDHATRDCPARHPDSPDEWVCDPRPRRAPGPPELVILEVPTAKSSASLCSEDMRTGHSSYGRQSTPQHSSSGRDAQLCRDVGGALMSDQIRLYLIGAATASRRLRDQLANHAEIGAVGESEHVARPHRSWPAATSTASSNATRSSAFPAGELAAIRRARPGRR